MKGWTPTDKDLDEIERLAYQGCSQATIAVLMGFTPTHWPEVKKRHPVISERILKGQSRDEEIASELIADLISDEMAPIAIRLKAAQFKLERKHKWKETVEVEHGTTPFIEIDGADLLKQLEEEQDGSPTHH